MSKCSRFFVVFYVKARKIERNYHFDRFHFDIPNESEKISFKISFTHVGNACTSDAFILLQFSTEFLNFVKFTPTLGCIVWWWFFFSAQNKPKTKCYLQLEVMKTHDMRSMYSGRDLLCLRAKFEVCIWSWFVQMDPIQMKDKIKWIFENS